MHNSNIHEVDHGKGSLMIAKIAKALDCPVDDFFSLKSSDMGETAALLAVWYSIRDARDREKVLAYLRTVAGTPSHS